MSGFQSGRSLDAWGWLILPSLLCIAATIVLATPFRLWGLRMPEPVFALVPAFAWAVIRPSILPPFLLIGLGFFLDIFWGAPLGLWAAGLLAAYAGVFATRPMMAGQSKVVMWIWYAAACLTGFGAAYLVSILTTKNFAHPVAVGWQVLVTIALYPLADRLIDRYEDADVRFR